MKHLIKDTYKGRIAPRNCEVSENIWFPEEVEEAALIGGGHPYYFVYTVSESGKVLTPDEAREYLKY